MKTTTCIALAFTLAIMLTAGCGGGDYQAPPKGNERPKSNTGGGTGGPAKKEPTGPSYSKEYEKSGDAALAAWKQWADEKTPANFAKVGKHLYDAQRYKIMSDRNGHSTANFHRMTEVSRLFTDWKKTFQTGDWENDADYKEAKHAYNDLQQEN